MTATEKRCWQLVRKWRNSFYRYVDGNEMSETHANELESALKPRPVRKKKGKAK